MRHQSQDFKKKIIIFWLWRPFWYDKGPINTYFKHFFKNPPKLSLHTCHFFLIWIEKKLFSKATSQVKLANNRKRAFWKIILSKVALENNFFSIQIKKKVPSMYYRFKDNFTGILKKIIKIGFNRTFFIPKWSSKTKNDHIFFWKFWLWWRITPQKWIIVA